VGSLMMSANDDRWIEWFKTNYPHEFYLQEEIVKRTEEIFRTVPERIPDGKIIQAMIGMVHNPNTGKPGIALNPTGAVFLGALGKGILDSLTAQFEGLLSSEIGQNMIEKKVKEVVAQQIGTYTLGSTKKCASCGNENQLNAKFCDQCANKF
jgi:hypothetical protein